MRYRTVIMGFVLFISGQSAFAQYFPQSNDTALRNVLAFDAHVVIPGWLGVEQDKDQFLQQAQSAFEVGLRRDGVTIDLSAPNYLLCVLNVAQVDDLVFFTRAVQYWEWSSNGLHRLIWESGGVVTRVLSSFDHRDAISGCVDQFTNQWLKHNPR